MATKKKLFDEDFLKVKSNVPSLRPNESAKSFKKRVQMWSSRTGLKFPTDRYSSEGRALLGLGEQPLGTQDYTSGYTKELNELVQRQNRRVTANTKAEEKLKKVPKSGFSDLRGDLRIKQDKEAASAPPNLDEISQYSDVQDTSGYAETEALLTPMYDAQNDPFKGLRTEEDTGEITLASFQGSDSAAIDAGNSKSLQQQLKIRPDGMSQIEFENRRRFGDTHVQNLIDKNVAFQSMKRGEMSKQQFADAFPTSNLAKRLSKLKIKRK
tara:strand:+ start:239 stop:1042 length:804 start_codon:yes stop_codon:yes gene_type:complete